MAKIRISVTLNDSSKVHALELTEDRPGLIGRESAWLLIPSPMASRRHCELAIELGKLYVIDLRSTSGTYVNGHRVEKQELRVGDVLQVGEAELCYEGLEVPESARAGAAHSPIRSADRTPTPSLNLDAGPIPGRPATTGQEIPRGGNSARPKPRPASGIPVLVAPKANASAAGPGAAASGTADAEDLSHTIGETWTLESIGFHKESILQIATLAVANPRKFFQTADLAGDVGRSFYIMAAAGAACVFLQAWTSPLVAIFGLPFGAVGTCLGAIIFAGIQTVCVPFTAAKGDFAKFLRFSAVIALSYLPIALVAGLPLMRILSMPVSLVHLGWMIYGYFIAFRPRIIPALVVQIAPAFIFILISALTLPFRSPKGGTQIARIFGESLRVSESKARKRHRRDPASQTSGSDLKLDAEKLETAGKLLAGAAALGLVDKKEANDLGKKIAVAKETLSTASEVQASSQGMAATEFSRIDALAAFIDANELKREALCAEYRTGYNAMAEATAKIAASFEAAAYAKLSDEQKTNTPAPKTPEQHLPELKRLAFAQKLGPIAASLLISTSETEKAQYQEMLGRMPASEKERYQSRVRVFNADDAASAERFLNCIEPEWRSQLAKKN